MADEYLPGVTIGGAWEMTGRFRNQPLLSPGLAPSLLVRLGSVFGRGHETLHFVLWAALKAQKGRPFNGFEPDGRDVFVATYTKSGTNWALQICQQIIWRGAAEFEHIHDLVAWPEAPVLGLPTLGDRSMADDAPTGKRVIKTAVSWNYLPWGPEAKYIAVLRDPKEIVVSAYHFLPMVMGIAHLVTPEQWLARFLGPRFGAGSIGRYLAEAWRRRDEPNALLLRYRDMQRDLGTAVDAVAALLGVELTDPERAAVVERSGYAWMKAHEERFAPPIFPLTGAGGRSAKMLRSGKSGNAGELYDRDQQAAIDRHVMAELQALGSDFPYRELFDVVE